MSQLTFSLKRITSLVLALLMIAGTMVLTMGTMSNGALPKAEAQDDPPTPGVNLTLKKEYDGTGHGTENQTFINNWNGYQVGDNTPNDGIVATNDTVGYSVELSIEPGPARTFNLAINTPEYLELVSSNLCDNGPGYTVTGSGEQCTIHVQEGANLLATRQITLKAKSGFDSNVSPEQVLTLEANKTTLSADPVKIVQSPRVDLTVTGQSSTVVYRQGSAGNGYFVIDTYDAIVPGYSSTKGAVSASSWTADINVSEFPAGTTFRVGGTAYTPDENGWLRNVTGVRTENGTRLNFTIPTDFMPVITEPYHAEYSIDINVHPSSFSIGEALNFGDGKEPGSNQRRDLSTRDTDRGTIAGTDYPNNNSASVRVGYLPPGNVIDKKIQAPGRSSDSIFEDSSRFFDGETQRQVDSSLASTNHAYRYENGVSDGTEMRVDLLTYLANVTGDTTGVTQVVMADTWNKEEQYFDSNRLDSMITKWGDVDVTDYQVYYSNIHQVKESGDGYTSDFRALDSGWWTTEKLPDEDIQAVAILMVKPEGAGDRDTVHWQFPVKLHDSYPVNITAGTQFFDFYSGYLNDSVFESSNMRSVLYQKPVDPSPYVNKNIQGDKEVLELTETVVYDILPGAINYTTRDQAMTPTIVDYLDEHIIDVQLLPHSAEHWNMVITPNQNGGSILTFTPKTPTMLATSWFAAGENDTVPEHTNIAAFPVISYSGRVSGLAPVANSSYTVNNTAEVRLAESFDPDEVASDSTTAVVNERTDITSVKEKDTEFTEIEESLGWTLRLFNHQGGSSATTGDVRIMDILPWVGSSVVNSRGEYNDYHGDLEPTRIEVLTEESAPGTKLWFTNKEPSTISTDVNEEWEPTNEAPTTSGWYSDINSVPGGLSAVTAIIIEVPNFGAPGATAVSVKIDANLPGSQVNDTYINQLSNAWSSNADLVLPEPGPVTTYIVDSSISGKVWWDSNRDTRANPGERGMEGILVTLNRLDEGNGPQGPWTTLTDVNGDYSFDGLHSGNYEVSITRGNGDTEVRTITISDYGRDVEVEQTYSWLNQRYGDSKNTANPLLGVNHDLTNVDFGFHAPNPEAKLDKMILDQRDNGDGTVDIDYQVEVHNTGNAPLTDGYITDTMENQQDIISAEMEKTLPKVKIVDGESKLFSSWAITDTGELYRWGENYYGGIGNGTTEAESTPFRVPIDEKVIKAGITDYNGVSYAITENGNLYMWGRNDAGQVGDGTFVDRYEPYLVPIEEKVVDFRPTDDNAAASIALTESGDLYSWGRNNLGQVGDGTKENRNTPYKLPLSNVVDFYQDKIQEIDWGYASYAITGEGELYVWGSILTGDGTEETSDSPKLVDIPGKVISAGVNNPAHAITDKGDMYVWGSNRSGVAGHPYDRIAGSNSVDLVLTPYRMPIPEKVIDGNRGYSSGNSYALTESGNMYIWGRGDVLGPNQPDYQPNPVKIDISNVVYAQVQDAAMALTSDGEIYMWGQSYEGEIPGTPERHIQETPLRVPIEERIVDFSPVEYWSYTPSARTLEGYMYTWGGYGVDGLVGDGTTDAEVPPYKLPIENVFKGGLHGWGSYTNYAVTSDGKMYTWGSNRYGEVGNRQILDGTYHKVLSPYEVTSDPLFDPEVISRSSITPVETMSDTTHTSNKYSIGNLDAGAEARLYITARVNKSEVEQFLTNMAYYRSNETPHNEPAPVPPTPHGSLAEHEANNWGLDSTQGGEPVTANIGIPDDVDRYDAVPVYIPASPGDTPPTPVTIGDRVWFDENSNGIQDAEETTGVEGVTVTIWNSTDTELIGSTTTDSNGEWTMKVTPGQKYKVYYNTNDVLLEGVTPGVSPSNIGDNRAIDSNGLVFTTDIITSDDLTYDLGLTVPTINIGDYVWLDENRDGYQDIGESGIPNVSIVLTKVDYDENGNVVNSQEVGTTTTDQNGHYSFTVPVLPEHSGYVVHYEGDVTHPDTGNTLTPTITLVGDDRDRDSNENYSSVPGSESDLSIDFGFITDTPLLDISKVAVEEAVTVAADGSATVAYNVVISNTGDAPMRLGVITDTPVPPVNSVVDSVALVHPDGSNTTRPGGTEFVIGDPDRMIQPGETLTYQVLMNITVDMTLVDSGETTPGDLVCENNAGNPNGRGGVINRVTTEWGDPHNPNKDDDEDCVNLTIPGSSIQVIKKINGYDANNQLAAVWLRENADSMTVTYEVTNTGETVLENIVLGDVIHDADDQYIHEALQDAFFVLTDNSHVLNGGLTLAPGESAVLEVIVGSPSIGESHVNTGTVTGTIVGSDPVNPRTVTDDDPAHAYRLPTGFPLPATGAQSLVIFLGSAILIAAAGVLITLRKRDVL